MSSTIKVNNISNLAGDDSGIDLSTNDQVIIKTANTSAITVNASQATALGGNLTIPNGGTIGSVGDIDAMTISSGGVVTFANTPVGVGGGITLATTVASTSGSAIDFTGIPSTAKRISVLFRGVSSANSDLAALVQLGTSSGFVTSGYISTTDDGGSVTSDTTGFAFYGIASGNILSGIMTIAHMGSNVYVSSHSGKSNPSNGIFGGGDVSVGGTVTQVRIKQVSGGSFDAGSINISYE